MKLFNFKSKLKEQEMAKQEELPEEMTLVSGEDAIPMVETPTVEYPPVDIYEVDESKLTKEERRLRDAQKALRDVLDRGASIDEEEVQRANNAMLEAQAKLDKAKAEKEGKLAEANRKVMEAQSDIELAKKQKETYGQVCDILAKFKSTPMGMDMPDETALPFAMLMDAAMPEYGWRDALLPTDWSTTLNGQYLRHVSGDDLARNMAAIFSKLASYHAYRKRINL